AAASHDLRQPLHALGLFVAQLHGDLEPGERSHVMARIDTAVTAMNELFNALLDISKLDAEVLTPKLTRFPVAHLFARLETTFAAAAREKGLRLRIVPGGAWVTSDIILLERVMLNLASNAVRYTDRGGVVIGARRRGATLRLDVWDSGIGIPDDQRRNILGEFYQIPDGDSRRAGLGLGLAIVDRLCGLLDHPLELVSRVGKGSRFSLSVPLAAAQPRFTEPALSPALLRNAADQLILIIDDEALVRDGMGGLLRRWGYAVATADGEDAALSAAATAERPPDLIISDYRLGGGVTGIETIARLHAAYGAAIPAFLISGDTAPERLRDAQASGYHLLHKPVQPMKLRAMVAQLLKRNGNGTAGTSRASLLLARAGFSPP